MSPRSTQTPSLTTNIAMHVAISAAAFAVLLALAAFNLDAFSFLLGSAKTLTPLPTIVAIESPLPFRADVTIVRKGATGYATFDLDTSTGAGLSVPSEWRRTEVRGARLADIVASAPALGFSRYQIPADAGLTFTLPAIPTTIEFISPLRAVGSIDLHSIDLTTDAHLHRVHLVKDATTVDVWNEE